MRSEGYLLFITWYNSFQVCYRNCVVEAFEKNILLRLYFLRTFLKANFSFFVDSGTPCGQKPYEH